MPPSGFSQKAINGLLDFVSDAYQNTLNKYKSQGLSEKEILRESIQYLEKIVKNSAGVAVDGIVSEKGIKGLQAFVVTNYEDLLREIYEGKKIESQAMQTEIEYIESYLARFKI